VPNVLMAVAAVCWISTSADRNPRSSSRASRTALQVPANKWYFDELYDRSWCAPRYGSAECLWKGGDGFVIDGMGPDGVLGAQ